MNTNECIRRSQEAIKSGSRAKVFDWDYAAILISRVRETSKGDLLVVVAGLIEDFENTGGIIFDGVKDEIVTDSYTYLRSNWATPCIVLVYKERLGPASNPNPNPRTIGCWKYEDETDWDEHTKWPVSAVNILYGGKENDSN